MGLKFLEARNKLKEWLLEVLAEISRPFSDALPLDGRGKGSFLGPSEAQGHPRAGLVHLAYELDRTAGVVA